MNAFDMNIPKHWDKDAHVLFLKGNIEGAVNRVLKTVGKNILRFRQAMYYTYMYKDYKTSLFFANKLLHAMPNDIITLKNIASCYLKLGMYNDVIKYLKKLIVLKPDDHEIFSGLAHAYGRLGDMVHVVEAGTKALVLKDLAVTKNFELSDFVYLTDVKSFLDGAEKKKSVCSFSLFGREPRYLCGALYNVLMSKELYPGWTIRFYADETVPKEFRDLMLKLGAEVILNDVDASVDMKLCWRFLVASDPTVGRFVVRDCDSAFSLRESIIVDEWIDSGKIFHVIRDWYSHTDLMLAGLWGGVAGVIPDIQSMINNFFSMNTTVSPNLDQFFLRETIWPIIKEYCIIHDRYFNAFSPRRPPMRHFRTNDDHIGSNRFATDRDWQEKFLAPWIREVQCIQDSLKKNK